MSLERLAREFAAKYPRPSLHPSGPQVASWDQMCGNLVYRFGAFTTPGWGPRITGPNAWNVGLESGPRNMDASRAPAGAIHWWRNRNASGMPGHTAVDLTGGGRDTFMATWAVRESLGSALGIQSVAGYSGAKTFMEYMGWTNNYAGARFAFSGTAGGGYTPIEEDDMFSDDDRKLLENVYYAITPGKAGVKGAGVLYSAVLGVPARTVALLDQATITQAVKDAVAAVGGVDADAIADRTVALLQERLSA